MSASREKNKRKEEAAAPAAANEAKKGMSKGLKTTLIAVCAVLIVCIVVFFYMLTSGFFASHTTAATVGTHKLTPAMVNYFYKGAYSNMQNQYGDFMSYVIDSDTPLDEQVYDEESGETWADYFTDQGLINAANAYALYDAAKADGHTLSEDEQASIDSQISSLALYASYYGTNTSGYIAGVYGTGCNEKNFREYLEVVTLADSYATATQNGFTYTDEQIADMRAYLQEAAFDIRPIDSPFIFDIRITVYAAGDQASARIVGSHTNLVQLLHGTKRLIDRPCSETVSERRTDRSVLTVERIVDFAQSLCPEDVQEIFERQISYNMAIAEAGLAGSYGANVGKTLREAYGETVQNRARYMAAAASDARMSGCELPVIINSGSGNQGITASVPVVVYAEELGVSRETLYRALAVSNLSTIHIKAHIGTLSAYCGAVSAGCGAGAGITYLYGGGYEQIKHTLVNAMAITSGIICDGAKPSCAAKIATSVDAGLLGYHMYRCGNQFYAGDGIVKSGIEHTIETVGALAHTGMADTDRQIIRLMMEP